MNYRIKLLFFLFFGISNFLNAQISQVEVFAKSISIDDLTEHVYYLSSDKLRGREFGDIGQDIAAKYISDNFYSYSLDCFEKDNKYYQKIKFINLNYGTSNVFIDSINIFHKTFYCSKAIQDTINTEIIFAGNATENDLKDLKLTNQAIAILGTNLKETYDKIGKINSRFGIKTFLVIFPTKSKHKPAKTELSVENYDSFVDFLEQKLDLDQVYSEYNFREIYQKYESNLIHEFIQSENDIRVIIVPEFYMNFNTEKEYSYFGKSYKELNELSANNELTEDNILLKLKNLNLSCTTDYKVQIDTFSSNNVIGFINGTEKKDESIIITAHFDHLGRDNNNVVYAGADDNASGTAALMELAQAFALAEKSGMKPKRTIILLACAGEESGLLGSKFYVDNPLFPLNKTLLNINMDMIGRQTTDTLINQNSLYVLRKGSMSKKVLKLVKKQNKIHTKLSIIETLNKSDWEIGNWIEQSDHFPFSEKGIPITFFHTGLHDDYHTVSDRPEKIDYEKLTKITQLLFYTIWELANE